MIHFGFPIEIFKECEFSVKTFGIKKVNNSS